MVVAIFVQISFCADGEVKIPDFDAGVMAYAKGDLKSAKKLLLKVEWSGDAKSRFTDFLLSDIAVKEGDLPLAKERFARAFKNLPEGNEELLAKNLTAFCDLNELFDFEAQVLEPFYETHKDFFKKDSLSTFRFARALLKSSKPAKSAEVLKELWQNFADNYAADGVDELLFDKDCAKLIADFTKRDIDSPNPLKSARAKVISGDENQLKSAEDPSMGLLVWLAKNGAKVGPEDIEGALEKNPNSEFAWQAWLLLAKQSFEEGQYELAYNFAQKAETLAPDSILQKAKIYILLGDADRFLKRYSDAELEYKKVTLSRLCVGELAAEASYKMGLLCFEQKKWKAAYTYFDYVFTGYEGFDFWSSRAFLYAAKAQLEMGNNLNARNVLLYYLKTTKHRDTDIYQTAAALWSRIKLN